MGEDSLHANRHLPLTEAGVFPTEIKRSTRMAPDAPANSDFVNNIGKICAI